MKFDRLFGLFEEGLFSMPRHVLQPIIDYYNETYKKVLKDNRKRISNKTFPPKIISLDFTGTQWEFLQKAFKHPAVWVSFSMGQNESFFNEIDHLGNNTMKMHNMGNITLDFGQPIRVNYEVIEHEVMHYIQYLIKEYRIKKLGEKNAGLGGLAPKNLIDKKISIHGYRHDAPKQNKRRVEHTRRPIEYYTDLLSAVRDMQHHYNDAFPFHGSQIPSNKKAFFKYVVQTANGEVVGGKERHAPLAERIFKALKGIDETLYRRALKIAYDAFVNHDPPFSKKEINALRDEIKQLRDEAKKKAAEAPKVEKFFRGTLSIQDVDRGDYSRLNDGNYEFGEDVFYNIPYTQRKEDKWSNTNIHISMKWPHLKAIFKWIRDRRDRERETPRKYDSPEENKQRLFSYNYLMLKLLKQVFREINAEAKFTPEELEDIKRELIIGK